MIVVKSDSSYVLCDQIVEYGSKEEPWVSLKHPVHLSSLPTDDKDVAMIWKHAEKGTGFCTTKKSIKVLKEIK